MDPEGPAPAVRIGDDERRVASDRLAAAYARGQLDLEEYEERLQQAHAARTAGELEPLLHDLPVPAAATTTPQRGGPGGRSGGVAWIAAALVAVLAVAGLGRVIDVDRVTVFGSSTIQVEGPSDDVSVLTVFGSTQVVVAEGVQATPSVVALFASTECDAACSAGTATLEQVEVGGLTLFGSVEIVRPSARD